MNNADTYLSHLLEEYKELAEKQRQELKELPEGQLSVRRIDGKVNYVQSLENRQRRGITKNQQLIQDLARKKYLLTSLAMLDKNIPLLDKLVAVHKAPTPMNIMELLSKTYKQLPSAAFLPEIRQKSQWADADYEQSSYKPEERIHTTANGLKVRSKSEVVIAEKLDAYNIPFRYEQMLYIENHSFSPDFTILQGETLIYWEHCGLVNNPNYMKNHTWKMSVYAKAGIVPWKNLIVTYDDENGSINTRAIDAEIAGKLL